ncbi:potassium channel related protein [Vibrio variabilis]|uniref:Potassium channel related protein n=1 Tax=Vibrio variabilis TaxID=990271 RepID=A0ABQ0JQ29_9VIBR|nr:potassium channel related protein [Vibrio variabilis]
MVIWIQLRKWLHSHLFELKFRTLMIALLLYAVISWALLWLSGEADLTLPISQFIYFIVVTASTVATAIFLPRQKQGDGSRFSL